MTKKNNILVIGDTHIPYEHPDYLDFCIDVSKRYGCGRVVHIGDEVDNHSISYHEHVPELDSPERELGMAIKHLKNWYKAFKKVDVCIGNHTALPTRKMRSAGLPLRYIRPYKDVLEAPDSWNWHQEIEIDGVLFKHTMYSGYTMVSLLRGAEHSSQSLVCGHAHSIAGVAYSANNKQLFFAMAVGCGIDRKALSFDYGELNRTKPILGCGVVEEGGRFATFVPMKI